MNGIRWGFFLRVMVCLFLLHPPNSFSAINSWTWGAGGFWRFGTNWSLGSAPGTNATLVQLSASGAAKTIIVDTNCSPTNLTINGLLVSSLSSKSNWLVISNLSAANPSANPFRILGSAAINGISSSQGRLIVTNSTVILDGTNGDGLSVSNGLVLLQPGAEFILTNGAIATIGSGAAGTLTVGTNSAFRVVSSNLVVGNDLGAGTMTVSGGTVEVGFTFTIGEQSTATGNVVVAGGFLRATNMEANAEIGQHGGGQLTLSNGVCQFDDVSVGRHDGAVGNFKMFNGLCSGSDLSVGRFTNALGFFTMSGGRLIFDGDIFAGREGTGTVSVTGGSIQAQSLLVGCTNGSRGTATFTGGTSIFSSALCLGSLKSTGIVTIAGGTFICTNAGSTGVVDVVGGTLAMGGGANVFFDSVLVTNTRGKLVLTGAVVTADQLTISNGAPCVVGNGTNATTLRLTGGTSIFANGLTVLSNATVIGSGAIYGSVLNSGTIVADQSSGALVFYGAVTNNRTMIQTNGGFLDFRSSLVNNGSIIPRIFTQNRITQLKRTGTTNEIFFSTKTGFSYTLEMKNSANDSNWMPLGTVGGNDATNSLLDLDASGDQRLYHIRIQ